jgi:polysaccharide export outer membrane protein
VRLTRGSSSAVMRLSDIVENPGQNIYLRPDDQLFVFTDPQTFTALGATGRSTNLSFDADQVTLAEAVGRVGGLNDARANPRAVFIFRYEDPEVFDALRAGRPRPAQTADGVPVVYQADMKDPKGYFAAQRFLMRDNDIIYVANSATTGLQKFFGILNSGVGTTQNVELPGN